MILRIGSVSQMEKSPNTVARAPEPSRRARGADVMIRTVHAASADTA